MICKKLTLLPLLIILTLGASAQHKAPDGKNYRDTVRMIEFDGFMYNLKTGAQESVQSGVMDTRVDDIFKLQTPPKYAPGVKPDPRFPWRPFFQKSPIMLGAELSAGRALSIYQLKVLSKTYTARLLPDSANVTLLAMGINQDNVKDYRYRVVADDSVEIVHWTTPQLQQQHGAKKPYGFWGCINLQGSN